MKSAGHGCLATADAMGAQATECFGKEEKAACFSVLNATCERQENKSTKERKQGAKYVNISLKCGETTVSVYLYSSIRIIPSPIHSSSHAFRLLIFLLTGCSLHTCVSCYWRAMSLTAQFWLAVLLPSVQQQQANTLVSHWTNLAPQCGDNTTNAVLTLLRSRVS